MNWVLEIDGRVITSFEDNKIQEYVEDLFRNRTKLIGSIICIDNKGLGLSDYSYIRGLDKNIKHTITIKYGKLIYTGEFPITAGEFNHTEKKVIFTPEQRDIYTVIQEKEDIEVNVLANESILVPAKIKSWLVFSVYKHGTETSEYMPDFPEASLDYWRAYFTNYFSGPPVGNIYYTGYVSERIIVNKHRDMTGWTEIEDYGSNKLYAKSPTTYSYLSIMSFFNGDILISDEDSIDDYTLMCPLQSVTYNDPDWEFVNTNQFVHVKKSLYNGPEYVTGITNYYYSYKLKDCLSTLLKEAIPEFTGLVKSTLLFSDTAETGGPDYHTGYYGADYVTGRFKYDKYVIHKSDFINCLNSKKVEIVETSSGKRNTGIATIKKLVDAICAYHKAKWWIDSDGNFRIEHVSYPKKVVGLNIKDKTTLNQTHKYLTDEIPNRVLVSQNEGWGTDFTQKEIVYGNIPVIAGEKENKEDINIDFLCTDIDGANQHLDELSEDGFMYFEFDGSLFTIKSDTGKYSGLVNQQNMGLSIANILFLYYRHNCYKQEFLMNGKTTQALTLKKIKIQDPVIFISSQKPNIKELIETNIGVGEIDTMEYPISEEKSNYSLKVLYD